MPSNTDTLSVLSKFVASLRFDDLPQEVIGQLKMFLADYVASAYAGMLLNAEANEMLLSVVTEEGCDAQSSVFGKDFKLSAAQAAYVNAFLSHGADLDDGNKKAAGHVGTHVISSVLALAEKTRCSWADVAVAVIAGYEIFNRVASAAQPGIYGKGFHSTGVAGSIASAGACAKLLGMDSGRIYDAMALGALQASGLIIIDETAQQCKPLNAANAARSGIVSAQLAYNGMGGPIRALDHPSKGWFKAFAGDSNDVEITDGLGERFTILESYLKLYPSCRHTHSVIDAALELRSEISTDGVIDVSKIDEITISTYPSAIRSAGIISIPQNKQEAKFSIAYSFAVAFLSGGFALCDLDPRNVPADVARLASIVKLVSDEAFEDKPKGVRGAQAAVKYADASFASFVPVPKGEQRGTPLVWKDIQTKMRMCTAGAFDCDTSDAVVANFAELTFDGVFNPEVVFGTVRSESF